MNALQVAEPTDLSDHREVAAPTPDLGRNRRSLAAADMVAGLASAIVAAGLGFIAATHATEPTPREISEPTFADTRLQADVGTTDLRYEPGHSSGWHIHPGVHAVVVLAGTLTVYDQNCTRLDYGAGASYLGGSEPHLARNETSADVALAVTWVYERSSPMGPGVSVAPPARCDAR